MIARKTSSQVTDRILFVKVGTLCHSSNFSDLTLVRVEMW